MFSFNRSVATRIRETCFCRSTVKLQTLAHLPGVEPGIADYDVVPQAFATDQPTPVTRGARVSLSSIFNNERVGFEPTEFHVLPPAFTS